MNSQNKVNDSSLLHQILYYISIHSPMTKEMIEIIF